MSTTQIVPAPDPTEIWYCMWPQNTRFDAVPGDASLLEWAYTVPHVANPTATASERPEWQVGASGGAGTVTEFANHRGVPCAAEYTTAASLVRVWSGPYTFGSSRDDPAAFNPGYVSRRGRVLRVKFGHAMGAGGVIDTATLTGVGLFVTSTDNVGGTNSLPGGPEPRLLAAVELVDVGGVQGYRYAAYDAAGALLEAVPLEAGDAGLWSTFEFQWVAASAGRRAALDLEVNGVRVLQRDADGVLLEEPSAFAGGDEMQALSWGDFYTAGAVGTPRFLWWEAVIGRFRSDNVEVRT